MTMALKDVRATGVSLYRDGVVTGAQMRVPRGDFDALVREVGELLTPLGQHPEAKPTPDALVVRTVCGDIRVSRPDGCESVSTIYETSRAT